MTLRELAHAIAGRVRPRRDRKSAQITAQVFGELLRRWIALVRRLLQRLEHDVVEIAAQRLREPAIAGRRLVRGDARRRGSCSQICFASAHVVDPVALYGRSPDEQAIQQHAERVDIARGRDRLAANLLGTRVLGRQREEAVAVAPRARLAASGLSSFAMPKSSSFTTPCSVTSTLPHFRSPCTIRC